MAPLLGSGLSKQSSERVEWCPETESNRHVLLRTRDFKSRASASFTLIINDLLCYTGVNV